VPADIIAGIAELGLFGLSIPEAYGGTLGRAPDHVAMLIGTEEMSAASLAAGGSLMTRPEILVRALLSAGSEEQKRRWLPPMAAGELLVAVAVTEPDYGSDVAALQCRAAPGPDGGWAVDGAKLWCTFAGRAHLVMLLCRTGSEPGHRGLSLFVLEKPSYLGHDFEHRQDQGGVLRGRAIPTLGYRGLHTFELVFEDYRLPAEALLGEEGRGFYLQMEGFATGRLQTAARAVGVMQAAVRDTLAYTSQRKVFGKPVAEQELARQMIGRMAVRLHASRRLSYAAAALVDEGDGQVEASLAKLYASRMAEYVTRDAMQLFGGMGYAEETDVSRYFVDARVLAIFEGAEEVLALRVIGRALEKSPQP
jgi:(2S)-methylsuccinyl-CoA dehydrogenase